MGCTLDFLQAYAATSRAEDVGLDYQLKRFGDAFTAYLARLSAWPPQITIMMINVPQRLAVPLEVALFRSSVELLLTAVDAGSPEAGVTLQIHNDTTLLRIWAAGHPRVEARGSAMHEKRMLPRFTSNQTIKQVR